VTGAILLKEGSASVGRGVEMHNLISEMYDICRSITGDGVRKTLNILGGLIPLETHEVPSGTKVFDWTVPREWNIKDAYIRDSKGEKIVDFKKSNLHVLNYSVPVSGKIPLKELKEHLYTMPEQPDLIPYRTSYYREDWGFCTTHRQMEALGDGEYEVLIDSSLRDGTLTYGEFFIRGRREEEFLISSHICHPSLCNDNLSGIAVNAFLADELRGRDLEYSYRFLFIPGTIGSITWLSMNQEKLRNIKFGLIAACLGDKGSFTYKKSRYGNAFIDRAAENVLRHSGGKYEIMEFSPFGYDERQFCSPGINLPVGCLMRTPYGRYPEYHSSADNLDFISAESLGGSLAAFLSVVHVVENNKSYINLYPMCEPQLGRRGLYGPVGGTDKKQMEIAMLWVLNLSDRSNSLLDISERSGLDFGILVQAARLLAERGLIKELGVDRGDV
jgi:aminopeptidase-like protein